MSETSSVAPFGLSPEEQLIQLEAERKLSSVIAPRMIASALTNVMPDTTLPGPLGYIPYMGAAERAGAFAGHVYNVGRSAVNLAAGSELLPKPWEWTTTAGQHAADTENKIYTSLPHYTPTGADTADTGVYDKAGTLGSMVGGMLPVAPGGAIAALPTVARIPTRLAVPSTEGAVTNLAIASGLGLGNAALPQAAQAATSVAQTPTQPSTTTGQFSSDIDNILNPPAAKEQPASDNPFPTTTGNLSQDINGILSGQGPAPPPAPTFGAQGESGLSVGEVLTSFAVFAGTLAAARYMHGFGGAITTAARDARLNDPAYAQKATDFNNAQVAAQGTEISQGYGPKPRAEAPLPSAGTVTDTLTAAKTNTLDANELLRQYVKLSSDNPTAAEKLRNQVGLVFNDMSWQDRLREFLKTGVDDQTSLRMPSPKAMFDAVDGLSADRQKQLYDGLMAANELDNRVLMQQKGLTPNRYDFYNQSDQDLARLVVDMQRDPELRDISQQYQQITKRIISIGEARNFFSAAEARDITTAHPNHVADVDNTGRVIHAMGPRTSTPYGGVEQVNTNPMHALAQHIETLYRQYELNELRTAMIDHQLNVQRDVPTSAQFVTRQHNQPPVQPSLHATVAPQGVGPREPVIAIRRNSGVEYYRINNSAWFDLLSGNNATKMKAHFDAFGVLRRAVQSGTTGILSTLSGRIFPPLNALRTGFQAQINRPAGMAGGAIDALVQKGTGGRVGWRLPDPSFLLGVPYSMARSSFDDLALLGSHMFHPSNPNTSTQLLKSIITPTQMQAISDSLKNYYLGTTTHEMKAAGISGGGTPFRGTVPAFSRTGGESPTTIRLVSGQLQPRLFLSGGKLGTIRPYWIRLQNAANEVFTSIGDAGHEYFYRANKFRGGIDKDRLAYETRNIVGDPGVSGSGTFATGIRSVVPYANVSAQGVSRFARAMKETPLGTSTALISSLGSAAMLSLLTAMQNKDTLDHIQNVITTQGRAANVILYGSANPALHTAFSLPQELRPVYAMLLDVLSKAFNVSAAQSDDNHHDGLYGFLKDWFSQHVENSTWQSALHGMADTFNIVDVPQIANAVSTFAGNSVARVDLERIVSDIRSGHFGTSTFTMPTGTDRPLPNHPAGDNALAGADSKKWSTIASQVFGMFGGMVDHVLDFPRYYAQSGGSPIDKTMASLGQIGNDWVQGAKDINPMFNHWLWENQVRESVRPAVVEKVTRTLTAMKNDTQGAQTAEHMEGTTGGPRALPVSPSTSEGRVPKDPTMRSMFFATAAEYNFINKTVLTDINALKKQMGDRDNQMGDNQEKRKWMNAQTRTITDKYRYVQARIDDLNAAFSRKVGASVDVGHIDWSKGPEQFTN